MGEMSDAALFPCVWDVITSYVNLALRLATHPSVQRRVPLCPLTLACPPCVGMCLALSLCVQPRVPLSVLTLPPRGGRSRAPSSCRAPSWCGPRVCSAPVWCRASARRPSRSAQVRSESRRPSRSAQVRSEPRRPIGEAAARL